MPCKRSPFRSQKITFCIAKDGLLCSRPFTYRYYWLPMASAWTVIGTIVGGVLMSQVVAVAMALMKNVLDFTKIFHYLVYFCIKTRPGIQS